MADKIRILGITGSLRKNSYNRAALNAVAEILGDTAEMQIADLSVLPFFNQDLEDEGTPASVSDLVDLVKRSDAILMATPEYNFSIPPVLKNALDWISREDDKPLESKPYAIMSATPGMLGGARVQYHLRQVCTALDMNAVNKPEVFIGGAHEKFNENGTLTDENTKKIIRALLDALIAKVRE